MVFLIGFQDGGAYADFKEKDVQELFSECKKNYIDLLQAHFKNKTKLANSICDGLCDHFLVNTISIKSIVQLHIESMKKTADSVNKSTSRAKVSSARSVLLMIMARYAHLLLERSIHEKK